MVDQAGHAAINALAVRAQLGDVAARDELLRRIDGVLVATARPYYGLDHDDLVQEARYGALRALESWKSAGGLWFLSYCVLWVRGRLGGVTRVEAYYRSHVHQVAQRDELAAGADDAEGFLEGVLASDDGAGAAAAEAAIDAQFVEKQLQRMKPRDSHVIRSRMRGVTLEEIGRSLGVSRERIRQLEPRLMKKLQVRVHAKRKVALG